MATLERIRRRSGLLIVVIGIAMLGFILTDLLGSGDSIFRGDANEVGRIEGRSIDQPEFSERLERFKERFQQQNPEQAAQTTQKQYADQVWDNLLREELLGQQYERLGITITPAELVERTKNNPNIRQAPVFQDQNTGGFSEALFQQYLTNIMDNKDFDEQAAEAYQQWVEFEREVKKQSLQGKYNEGVRKGIYIPEPLARLRHEEQNSQRSINFIAERFDNIADTLVEVSERELKRYYKDHKDDFKTETQADIVYVNFPISPSAEDLKVLKRELATYLEEEIVERKGMTDTVPSFHTTANDSLFAASRSDLKIPPDYYKREDLPEALDSAFFEKPVGHIEGPYRDGEYFSLTKITDRKAMPDSVRARHILLSFRDVPNGNQERGYDEAKELADSLLEVVRADTSGFADLAREISDDPGSGAQGGDLGWFDEGTMVRTFSNFCFRNETGDIALVQSNFGFHIIEILDQAGFSEALKLTTISREIQPSEATVDSIYNQASSFASQVVGTESFAATARERGYQARPVTGLEPFDENVVGLGSQREIVRWAHHEERKVGELELFSNNNASVVVALLTGYREEGVLPLEDVEEIVRAAVIKEKKGAQLKERLEQALASTSNLQEAAGNLNLNVTSQNISFASPRIQNFGEEPRVVGVAHALPQGKISRPIQGEAGVFVVEVQQITPAPELPDYNQLRQQEAQSLRTSVVNELFQALKENAKVKDRRHRFY